MEEIKKDVVNENEKSEMGGGAETKSAFLTEINPLVKAIIKITERYANPAEGERKSVAIVIAATDQDGEVNTTAICGANGNLIHALTEFALSDSTAEKVYMNAAARILANRIIR